MYLSSGEKKTLAILAAIALAFVVIVGGAVALLVRDSESHEEGYAQVAIDRDLIRVQPLEWCDLVLTECTSAEDQSIRHVPVAIDSSIMLSVSSNIADYPWALYTMYADAEGNIINGGPELSVHGSGETNAVVLTSTPDRVLVNIEIQAFSAVFNDDVTQVRGLLALATTPDGFEVQPLAPDAAAGN